ncbi:MAG: DNRLRE domain-containing protein, partial [Acidobacteriota bacterium]
KEVLSAKLRLTITDNGNNWGTGRTVDVHRLITNWEEGNGTENDRGTGSGATWNCSIDSIIANQAKNCNGATEWEMGKPNEPEQHPWIETPSATQTITNNQTGVVEYDVTGDVQSFLSGTNNNYGWIIKKTNEGQNGRIEFGTKESASVPQLVVTYQP